MKVTIEVDCTAEEFKDLFIPSERQAEFVEATYNAYVDALQKMMWKQIDPYEFIKPRNE